MLGTLLAVLGALGVGGWLWLRDSSLVAVERVTVTGESGPDAAQIRLALVAAARSMTTLDVKQSELRTAVAPYPVVKGVRVSTQFPHGMRIHVIEQVPVGAVLVAGHETAVAGDGTLLHDVVPSSGLPVIPLQVYPGGARVSDPGARAAVAVLAAAPYEVLARLRQVADDPAHGVVAQLRLGPQIYFGTGAELAAKWSAALAVLAAPGSAGAQYIDVTDPQRPAAGVGSDQTPVPGSSASAGTASPPGAAGATTAGTPGAAATISGQASSST